MNRILEPVRELMLKAHYDVIVCGGGPAGIGAALAAGRQGMRTLIIEQGGCLGGIWTSGLLCLVLDVREDGLMAEIKQELARRGATRTRTPGQTSFIYDVEAMKYVLEDMCDEAGVDLLLHTTLCAVDRRDGRIAAAIVENAGGRQAFGGTIFVDATGNGTLAALAGCGYDRGHPETGQIQPATLLAIVSGLPADHPGTRTSEDKHAFLDLIRSAGVEPSYKKPSLFRLPYADLTCFFINHEFQVQCDSAEQITRATMRARKELHRTVEALRRLPGWEELRLVATADHIGLREGRRIHGLYQVTVEDIVQGRQFEDGVCLVRFPVDVHSLTEEDPKGIMEIGLKVLPYHIPYRSLVARDAVNLGLAGRCVSGDFFAHASYRVTGNAVAMGEAVGLAASLAVAGGISLHELDGGQVSARMREAGHTL